MSNESNDTKDCIVVKDDDVEVILIRNNDSELSMYEALQRGIRLLREA